MNNFLNHIGCIVMAATAAMIAFPLASIAAVAGIQGAMAMVSACTVMLIIQ